MFRNVFLDSSKRFYLFCKALCRGAEICNSKRRRPAMAVSARLPLQPFTWLKNLSKDLKYLKVHLKFSFFLFTFSSF